jgi:hypothetical protein
LKSFLEKEDPPGFLLKKLTVRTVRDKECGRANELLRQEDCLGEIPRESILMQVVECEGRWVALQGWGPAAHKLADRDDWIDWTDWTDWHRAALCR